DNGSIVFASEPKNLVGICDKIMPFPPGHYYKKGEFICYNDISKPQGRTSNVAGLLIHHDPEVEGEVYLKDDLETVIRNIHDKLVAGVEKRLVADAKVGFLLSGGLDSSLVCAIAAAKSDKPIRTFAIGMTEDAIDLKYAKQVADFIGSEHTEVYMTPEQVISSLEDVIHLLGTYDITTIRASMGMYLVCKAIHETTDIRVLLTGEISDELFGYKYTDFAPDAKEFQKEAEKRIYELHMYDVLRADRCISVNSLEARVPFGDLDFVKYVMSVDPEMKMNKYGKGKYLLRKAFDNGEYLPDEILWREKAAFSDAVGHSMVDYLKEYAEKQISDEEFEKECKKYTHATPFTKESLLYRQIFEKYYPGQSEMVVDFWMPNKNWEGCNVNDPSARVLSNYGASGV
ncbi:MAG: asparagine synthetase B, partial [Lachnospiraceae bacterium]|nr:asparagine synthetase B [Lachnospiraceae bacterium]